MKIACGRLVERRGERVAFAFAVLLVSDAMADDERAASGPGYLELGRAEITDEVAPVGDCSGPLWFPLTCGTDDG